MTQRTFLSRLALMTLVACGAPTDDADPTDDGSDTDDTDPSVDTDDTDVVEDEAPEVVSTVPDLDTRGVLPDASITIQFSVPMDTDSVEAAFSSSALALAVTFDWDDATRVVITPDAPLTVLDMGEAEQGSLIDFTIGIGAKSAAGLALEEAYASHFRVVRRFTDTFNHVETLTGQVTSDGLTRASTFEVGDTPENKANRSFATFDVRELPAVVEVIQAVFRVRMDGHVGTPWPSLGDLEFRTIHFDAFDAALYDNTDLSTPIIGHTPNDVSASYSVDLTSIVAGAVEERGQHDDQVQIRVAFTDETDDDGAADFAMFSQADGDPRLTLDAYVY